MQNQNMKPKTEYIEIKQFNVNRLIKIQWCSINELREIFKQGRIMRDNNCKANHDCGLEKRIAQYETQHTINTMPNSPAKVHLAVKRALYGNVLKALKLV